MIKTTELRRYGNEIDSNNNKDNNNKNNNNNKYIQ